MEQTKTELHTHLMGMMTAEGFVDFLSQYLDCIYWPINEPISNATQTVPIASILNDKDALNSLRIPHGEQVDYFTLDDRYSTRTELLKLAAHTTFSKLYDMLEDNYPNVSNEDKRKIITQQAETTVYNDYINRSLQELVNQNVKYVEISYSNPRRIASFQISQNLQDKITCKFLLSTDRSRSTRNMKQSAKSLKKILTQGTSVGVDVMGQERPFSIEELDYNNSRSFQRKLEILFDELLQYDNTTLRIHSGEIPAPNNTLITLRMIDQIATKKGIVIPPPEIRVGHGLHFNPSEDYVNLLKKFHCIVELNASSNFGLKNIKDYNEIPYSYYLENDIPVVISTDGHGLYDTTIKEEDSIAKNHTTEKEYNTILQIDSDILGKKVK
ncbi:MAG TPA: hypothetical protein IAD45_06910 [Candidatus Faecimonas intestinavium]|nr:hypothetical protein [Bacilli bacterium]HIT24130.1 hypothetical protein [Candidatus Faecimonas intestinavium]